MFSCEFCEISNIALRKHPMAVAVKWIDDFLLLVIQADLKQISLDVGQKQLRYYKSFKNSYFIFFFSHVSVAKIW